MSFGDAIPKLKQGIRDGNTHVKIRQQMSTTFADGIVDEIVFTARRMGLSASSVSGRGWFNKPHLVTVEGNIHDVLRLYEIIERME